MSEQEQEEMVFLTPGSNYEILTAQVDFLGNSRLASDMRNVPSGTSITILAIAGIISFFLIVLVVPAVLWVLWLIRESRNKQRRNELSRSAKAFLSHTPVPKEKQNMVSQFH